MIGTLHRRLLVAVLAAAAVLAGRFLGGADPTWVLAQWLPDDAFYSLLPAWNAGQGDGFTFDGRVPTYGWQPLWTLLGAGVAALCPTKEAFLAGMLTLGVGLHLAAGALLFRLLEAGGRATAGVIAAGIWALGPDLLRVSATGLESGLVAALVVGLLVALQARVAAPWLGVLAGLLFLARVTTLPLGLLVGALVVRRAPKDGVGFALGFAAPVLPWLLFAHAAFGQALPTSGSRKLVEGLAGLGTFVATLPGLSEDSVAALLPGRAAALVGAEGLPAPSWSGLWTLGIKACGGWSLGHWLPRGMTLADGLRALGVLGLIGGLVQSRAEPLAPGLRSTVAVLLLFAAVHGLTHHLLLAGYVEYGYWYRVPELLAVVVVAALTLEWGLAARSGAGGLAVLAVVGIVTAGWSLRPRSADPAADLYATGVFAVAEPMNALPDGTVVGSWNAGLLGWLAEGPTVVNLDGLANDRAYLEVAIEEVLFRHGLRDDNPTLRWLDEHDVQYLVDIQPLAGLGTAPFYGVVPPVRYTPIARSAPITHWAHTDRDHAVALVRLVVRVAEPPGR